VTFKSAKDLQATCKEVPLDRMLIETDSPYLAPIPYRGKINEPAWVAKVGEFIAELKGVEIQELAKKTSSNFYECFQLDRKYS
jgi:TatD DNase family protein